MNYITYELSGRLGNQLQLFACARYLSLKYNMKFIYNPIDYQNEINLKNTYNKSNISKLLENFSLKYKNRILLDNHDWDESGNINGNMKPDLYMFKNQLFIFKWGAVFKDLSFYKTKLLSEILTAEQINMHQNNEIGLHIRRDDTEYGLPIEYYVNAIKIIKKEYKLNKIRLFSDGNHIELSEDIKKHISDIDITINKGSVIEDLVSLSKCKFIVISMSWFSYWAAFLSKESIVYCPKEFKYYDNWKIVDL